MGYWGGWVGVVEVLKDSVGRYLTSGGLCKALELD